MSFDTAHRSSKKEGVEKYESRDLSLVPLVDNNVELQTVRSYGDCLTWRLSHYGMDGDLEENFLTYRYVMSGRGMLKLRSLASVEYFFNRFEKRRELFEVLEES